MKNLLFNLFLAFMGTVLYGQAGELDLAFNGDGIFLNNLSGDDRGNAIALQADGKLLIAGSIENSTDDLFLMRLDGFGNPDLSFGNQGYITVDYDGDDESIQDLVVLANGSIITLAICDSANVTGALFSKFNASGQLDLNFGSQGHLFVHRPTNSHSNTWNDLALLPDGNLMAVGRLNRQGGSGNPGGNAGGVLKITPQGQVDATFGSQGLLQLQYQGDQVNLKKIIPLPNGNSLIYGTTSQQGNLVGYLAQLNSAGSLVASFGGNGEVITSLTSAPSVQDMALNTNGKIVLLSHGYLNGWSHMSVVQLQANGQLDQSFGTNGRADVQILNGHNYAAKLLFLPDGKLLLAGTASGPWNGDFALARLHTDGRLDQSFHFDGMVTKNISSGNDYVTDAVLQSDGRVVLVGNCNQNGNNSIGAARFLTGFDTSIDLIENVEASTWSVYPNPSSQWIKINTPQAFEILQVEFFNMQGQVVWQGATLPNEAINTQQLSAGMYWLKAESPSGYSQTIKVQVVR